MKDLEYLRQIQVMKSVAACQVLPLGETAIHSPGRVHLVDRLQRNVWCRAVSLAKNRLRQIDNLIDYLWMVSDRMVVERVVEG